MRHIVSTILFWMLSLSVMGEHPVKMVPVSLHDYLTKVSKENLSYIAEQFNVTIAEAQLKAAKIFADPEISIGYSNNQDRTIQMGQGVDAGISYPFSLGNKRGANVSLARSQKELAQSALEAYFQQLRAEATLSYFTAISQKNKLTLQMETGDKLIKLAQADSIRLKAGAINATDALQTALEARAQRNMVLQADADYQNALIQMAQMLGKATMDTLFFPVGEFPLQKKTFILPELIQSALDHRSDLQVAMRNKEISEKQIRLIQANRAFEFSLEAGFSHATIVKNEIAPAPAFNSYSAGISIPLKFSSFNKGELEAARNAAAQSGKILEEARLQITAEVNQAWISFNAAEKQLQQFQLGLVEDAAKILEARTYAYQRGETGVIDLLNAQHRFNDLQLEYQEMRYHYSEMLVLLEKSAGIWDVE